MWILLLGLSGFLATSWANTIQGVRSRSCSYVGVYHIQGSDRYSLTFEEAQELCDVLGDALATDDQLKSAYLTGMETCRYGWTRNGTIGIVRQKPNFFCAANQTGHIIINSTDIQYDAYCYDGTDLSVRNCTLAMNLQNLTAPGIAPAPTQTAGPERPRGSSDDAEGEVPSSAPTVDSTTEELTSDPASDGEAVENEWRVTSLLEFTTNNGRGPPAEPTPEATTPLTQLDSGYSGMGDPYTRETPEPSNEDGPHHHDVQGATAESDSEGTVSEAPEQTESPRGPLGADQLPPAEDKPESGTSDWLIIVGVVVAVVAILLVCAAVATRKRWCGRQQTLMITSKSSSEGNGAATSAASSRAQEREQEMVTLMNKEKIQENGNTEEFTVITLEESPEKKEQA